MLKNILSLAAGAPLDILWVVLIVAAAGALIFLLSIRVKRDRLYFMDISDKKRIFTVKEFEKSIAVSIQLKSKFYIYQLYARDYKDLCALHTKAFLEDLMDKAVRRIEAEMPKGVRICYYGEGRILVYVKEDKQLNVEAFAKSIKESASRKTVLGKLSLNIDFAVVAGRYPSDGASLLALLENMDIVLTESKRAGGPSGASHPSPVLAPQLKDAKEIEEIKTALKNKEFVLYYQPVIERKTMSVIGAECLIRWQHPKKGLIPPSAFLPVSERTGEIYNIGIWIFEEACRQLSLWRKNSNLPVIWLSLNMSIMQLSKPEIVKEFTKFLRKYNLIAGDFYLEIYVITLYSSMSGIKDTIDRLVGMGFKISIDKFGKGKASLTELEKFPLSQVKVDMPFLLHAKENILYSGIINALNDYVRQYNIMMVADGVETQDQLEWAKLYGINYMQGFYFAKPSSAEDFTDNALKTSLWNDTEKEEDRGALPLQKGEDAKASVEQQKFSAEKSVAAGLTKTLDSGASAKKTSYDAAEKEEQRKIERQGGKGGDESKTFQKTQKPLQEQENAPLRGDDLAFVSNAQPIKVSQSRLAQAAEQKSRQSLTPNASCVIGEEKQAPITIKPIPTRVDALEEEDN